MEQKSDFFINTLHIFVLCSFAVAQPLFDLLSRNAVFFVARHSKPVDVILLILILCVLLPLLVVLIEVVAGLFGRRVRKVVHGLVVACLVAIIVLPALKKIFEISGTAILVGAAMLGVMAAIAYIRFHPVRIFLTVLSPVLLIFPGLFLFNSPVFKVVFPGKAPSAAAIKVDNPAPIIIVVFDEFPVTSLMDEHRRVDPIRYPNFAALARHAYWFRNFSTVAESTTGAIPAILCGRYSDRYRMPIVADYPNNLFTLLGGLYEMKVLESITTLCPSELCWSEIQHFTITQRIYSMLSDLSVVYLHIVLPPNFTAGLPVVTQTWKDFLRETNASTTQKSKTDRILRKKKATHGDPSRLFREFIESITISDKPTLYFLHILLPHVPWEYLPSGKIYTEAGMQIPGLNIKKELWSENDWLVIQGYQRHLLQVGFVDKLVGDLLAKLKTINFYDQSLIVITADHGVNFWPNKSRRGASKEDPMDILRVPLFIKTPNQREGVLSDRNVESIDILPTIADILDIRLPWSVDGDSALNPHALERNKKIIYNYVYKRFVFDANLETKSAALKRKLALFGSGERHNGLFKIGPHSELVDRYVSELDVIAESAITVKLNQALLYEIINKDAPFVPAQINGLAVMDERTETPLDIAVAVNGRIKAVTRTYPFKKGIEKWSAIVPEDSFREGKNDIQVFTISQITGGLYLSQAKSQATTTYFLVSPDGETYESIISSKGTALRIIPNALRGHLDVAHVGSDRVEFAGWAADVKNSQLAEAIVIFVNRKFFYCGDFNANRPDLVKAFNSAALREAGFRYSFPSALFENIDSSKVRIFAMSKEGVASELSYPKGYKLGKKS
jgi:hypothetical protein